MLGKFFKNTHVFIYSACNEPPRSFTYTTNDRKQLEFQTSSWIRRALLVDQRTYSGHRYHFFTDIHDFKAECVWSLVIFNFT